MSNIKEDDYLLLYIEEYKTINERLITRANHLQNSVNFSVVLIIALFALLGTVYKDNFKIDSLILLVLPFPFYSLFFHYLHSVMKIDQYQSYIKILNKKIQNIYQVQDGIFNLDSFLKEQDKSATKFFNKTSNTLIIFGFFLLPPLVILLAQKDIGTVCSSSFLCNILIIIHIVIILFGGFYSFHLVKKLR